MITNDEALSILRAACAKEESASHWARKHGMNPADVLCVLRGATKLPPRMMAVIGYKQVKAWVKVKE